MDPYPVAQIARPGVTKPDSEEVQSLSMPVGTAARSKPPISPETDSIRTSAFPPPLCPIPDTAQRLKARWYAKCHHCTRGIYAGTIMIWQAKPGWSWHEQCFAERPARLRALLASATIAGKKRSV